MSDNNLTPLNPNTTTTSPQAMWGFARMEYRPPNQLLDAVLKVCGGGGGVEDAVHRGCCVLCYVCTQQPYRRVTKCACDSRG